VSDGLARLWAGWRLAYVTAAAEAERTAGASGPPDPVVAGELAPGQVEGCVLCRVIAPAGDDRAALVVWRGERCVAVLNAFPYGSGHLMVLPLRHAAELEQLAADEAAELWDGVRRAVIAIKAAYQPDGLNVGANLGRAAGAGVPGHLHIHVLPRWAGDTNFMTSVAGTRVMPEALADSWVKLTGSWPAGPERSGGPGGGPAGAPPE